MRLPLTLFALIAFTLPAHAELKAPFIDGTYVFADGACDKLKSLVAGGSRGVTSVPWYVTTDGISFWEGGCGFSEITPGKKKDQWKVTAACEENGDEYVESYIFLKTSPTTFSVTLTTPGASAKERKPVTYTHCDAGEIPPQ